MPRSGLVISDAIFVHKRKSFGNETLHAGASGNVAEIVIDHFSQLGVVAIERFMGETNYFPGLLGR